MFSHGFMTFATIGITVACLLIMGTFTLVAVNADACYTFTWTCTPEEDWMAAFAKSADSLWFRLQ